mmetsp:Transcript_84758/g.248446  ORF Transcript_84758/g.248446 Transcript_84758/m.248446 type:complete len:237 (+) Transcript_84758:362-1072(+)
MWALLCRDAGPPRQRPGQALHAQEQLPGRRVRGEDQPRVPFVEAVHEVGEAPRLIVLRKGQARHVCHNEGVEAPREEEVVVGVQRLRAELVEAEAAHAAGRLGDPQLPAPGDRHLLRRTSACLQACGPSEGRAQQRFALLPKLRLTEEIAPAAAPRMALGLLRHGLPRRRRAEVARGGELVEGHAPALEQREELGNGQVTVEAILVEVMRGPVGGHHHSHTLREEGVEERLHDERV